MKINLKVGDWIEYQRGRYYGDHGVGEAGTITPGYFGRIAKIRYVEAPFRKEDVQCILETADIIYLKDILEVRRITYAGKLMS